MNWRNWWMRSSTPYSLHNLGTFGWQTRTRTIKSTIIINLRIRTRNLYASFSFTRIRIPSPLMTQLPSERFIRSDSSLQTVMDDGVMGVRSPMKDSKIRQLYIIGYLEPNSQVPLHSFVQIHAGVEHDIPIFPCMYMFMFGYVSWHSMSSNYNWNWNYRMEGRKRGRSADCRLLVKYARRKDHVASGW